MKKDFSKINEKLMDKALNDPKYRGFHVVAAGGKIYKAKSGQGANQILQKVREKYPKDIPEYTFLPNAQSLMM